LLGRTKLDHVIAVLFVVAMGACGNFGGCGACGATQPLPQGGLPASQTVEGGAQIRVTPSGFSKLTSILPGVLNQQLGSGFCVPKGQIGSIGGFPDTGAEWCYTNANGCNPGCKANVSINPNGLQLSVTNSQTLHLVLSTSANATIPLHGNVLGIGASCTLTATSNNLHGDLDIAFGINPTTGELAIHLQSINSFQMNMNFGGCSLLSDIANLAGDIIDSFVGQFVIQLLTPVVDNLIQGFLPNPLGIAGMMDVGQLLASISPGTKAEMEARIVPGGYVQLNGNGMSLGVITGVNSDIDPSTRTGTRPDGVPYASEPALCVPPLPAPAFGAAPYSLPLTSRQTFYLNAANEFSGAPDPNADLAMGLSQTTFDQLGHHLVTSGGMCLGVGTSYIKQLNVGTIGILVPSLADLETDNGNDPLLLVTRPQREVSFTIGDNTTASPAITLQLSHLEVDFYAFLFERYVRAFTIDLTMNVGVNLTFAQQPGMPATITPSLVGIDASQIQVTVLNSEFVKETPQHLQMVLPSVFSLITPLLGNIPPITVPTFAGFSLNNLSIQHVTTSQDDFLALYASLGASTMMRQLGQREPLVADAVRALDSSLPPPTSPSTGRAHLVSVVTPPAEQIRGALLKQPGGALPAITFDVDRHDDQGRELEWSWNFNGGMWHEFQTASPLVISDAAFAIEGKYTIGLKSRAKGDYRTTSAVIETPVVIDSVGPKIFSDKQQWKGDRWSVPVYDVVSGKAVQVAFAAKGAPAPQTEWMSAEDAGLDRSEVETLSFIDGQVQVFAKDELGNQTIALIAPFHGSGGASGCTCQSTGAPGAGSLALFAIVGLIVLRRRGGWRQRLRRMGALPLVGAAALAIGSTQPGCSCSKAAAKSCEMASDCGQNSCPQGQLPFCIDNMCVCSDDIPPGRIGPYQHLAIGPDGSLWTSAYAQSHGDLVVAQMPAPGRIPDTQWEWVDGVPSGPVAVPNSKIRGGIADDGPNVGMYTSIAVAQDGTPMVTYFDVDNASLKFAAKVNGTWQMHTIDQGTGSISMNSGALVGMYTSISLRTDDGRPGVAYLAHVADAAGEHAEVRYASAQVPVPTQASDWQMWTVDTALVPAGADDVYPLPEGLGLWISSARDPRNQAPVVVYYDRAAGELKISRFDPTAGQFKTPVVLAGSNGVDEGWTPSVQVDMMGVAHVAYIDATDDDLRYITDAGGAQEEIVDDGYRIVGQTVDGYPKPEFHILADAAISLPPGVGPSIAYQDGTTQELLLAQKDPMTGKWNHKSIAGATDPWPGAYGFFASIAVGGTDMGVSSWVIDQPTGENWVEIFAKPVATF
jgi:MYXO-CTERM domain-containing protein